MGRKKSVPGPLTLTQTVPVPGSRNMNPLKMNGADRRVYGYDHSVKKPTIPTQAHSQTQPTQSQHQHRLRLGETSNILDPVRLSPPDQSPSINSLSPKSPRSPYTSKFSPKYLTKTTNNSQTQLHFQSQSPRIPSPALSSSASSSPSLPSRQAGGIPRKAIPQPHDRISPSAQPQQRPKPSSHDSSSTSTSTSTATTNHASTNAAIAYEAKQPHIAELQQRLPPLRKATTSTPQQQSQHHHQERRLKSSHGRRPEERQQKSSFSSGSSGKQGFFFNFHKSSKSSDRLPPTHTQTQTRTQTTTQIKGRQTADSARAAMNGTDQPPVSKQSSKQSDASYAPTPSLPSKSETSLADGDPNQNSTPTKKTSKPKPFTLLSRTKSHRDKDGRSPRHTPSPQDFKDPVPTARGPSAMETERPEKAPIIQPPPKTVAAPHDRAYREAMSSSSRAHSADRAPSRDASSDRRGHQDRANSRSHQGTPRDGNGPGSSSFFNNLRREGGRVAESIGKGLFGKGGRSASTTERDPVDDEHYVIKVINRPLVEQARLTRISKRLEESRDKTEFWMPAFPWRAIDYLNYKGCDVEGLYRVPGSGPQIKKWQRRFDEQYDVDLFSQEDLYDINIIGSMLKAWLRELPDELFPKEAQDRIARECAGSETVPQMLIDELSSLSPFNYYLLFAITCHLSLLLAHSDKNKMDFRNLCICFQPCMKIDAFCFKFLVCDWRDCWKGCKTEARYIEEEYKLFDQPPPPGLGPSKRKLEPQHARPDRRASPNLERDERDLNNSVETNGKRPQPGGDQSRLKKKSPPHENGKENGNATPKLVRTEIPEPQGSSPRDSGDMRPLSPIKPLSPLGF